MQETRLRNAQPDVHQNGLQDNCRYLSWILAEAALDASEVIERSDDDVCERGLGHTASSGNGVRRVGISVLLGFGLHADERRVMQTVIRTFKL